MNNYTRQNYSDRKQDFSDKVSVAIMVGLVVLSLIANVVFKDKEDVQTDSITEIRFPAYETEYEEINKAMPFVVNITLPEGWQFSAEGDISLFPQVKLHNPYFIYRGEECIGYIAFNIFTPPDSEVENVKYHQQVWPVIISDGLSVDQYMIVRLTDKFEAGYCGLIDGEKTADGILCYNKDLRTMVGIVLKEGVADAETLQKICLSLSFSAM